MYFKRNNNQGTWDRFCYGIEKRLGITHAPKFEFHFREEIQSHVGIWLKFCKTINLSTQTKCVLCIMKCDP